MNNEVQHCKVCQINDLSILEITKLSKDQREVLNKIAEKMLLRNEVLYKGGISFEGIEKLAKTLKEAAKKDIDDLNFEQIG